MTSAAMNQVTLEATGLQGQTLSHHFLSCFS